MLDTNMTSDSKSGAQVIPETTYTPSPASPSESGTWVDTDSIYTPTHTTDSEVPPRAYASSSPPPALPPRRRPFSVLSTTTSTSTSTSTIAASGTARAPEAPHAYMIRDLATGKALALRDGRLTLTHEAGESGGCGWCWRCTERDDDGGWLGFRESVSGRYLGRDGAGGMCARATRHRAWEALLLRPLRDGGYHILTCDWWKLRRVALAPDGEALVESRDKREAVRWEFIEVQQMGEGMGMGKECFS
ncbi:hypothetical protein F5X96DRAFT_293740 [Biscogniauxia mediterranea]|nr:hypothetical protein F5X96DRAFT_293740 [Biscogniauxia mediterranea]